MPADTQRLDLTDCYLFDNATFQRVTKCLPKLVSIDLTNCFKITDEGLHDFLNKNSQMQILDISGCGNLSDKMLKSIVVLCSNLQVLRINKCPLITTQGVISFMWETNNKIKELYIRNCPKVEGNEVGKVKLQIPRLKLFL